MLWDISLPMTNQEETPLTMPVHGSKGCHLFVCLCATVTLCHWIRDLHSVLLIHMHYNRATEKLLLHSDVRL